MRAMTDNPLHGLTLNPWDPAITCGGSSGGAASSVALGIGALAHGNDIGGSLRWPAFACGVSTIKPTTGRVPAFNASAGAERPMIAQITSSQGPIAREVKDVRLGFQAMIGRDPRDPWHIPLPFDGPAMDGPIKVAVAEVPEGFPVHDAVLAAVEDAARMLADAGYVVERVKTPDIVRPLELWFDLIPAEMRELQLDSYRSMATPAMNAIVDAYIGLCHAKDLKSFMAASSERTGHIRNWMLFLERYPLVLTPALPPALPCGGCGPPGLRSRGRALPLLPVPDRAQHARPPLRGRADRPPRRPAPRRPARREPLPRGHGARSRRGHRGAGGRARETALGKRRLGKSVRAGMVAGSRPPS